MSQKIVLLLLLYDSNDQWSIDLEIQIFIIWNNLRSFGTSFYE